MELAQHSSLPLVAKPEEIVEAVFDHPCGKVRVTALPDGRHRITAATRPGLYLRHTSCVTSYPLGLIQEIYAVKGLYVCDEIMREEDPRFVESSVTHEVLGYVEPCAFAGRRVLDFGCGAGASTLVLARLLPPCEIVGIDLAPQLLRVAKLRAAHVKRNDLTFMRSPDGDSLPHDVGLFDFVVFSAVFEHLLPSERPVLLTRIWDHLKPGGILFLNQTPHRYSLVDVHTTRLPLINYLPDSLALQMARRMSKRVSPDEDWQTLLRRGIRGGTVREILGIIARRGVPVLLEPRPHVGDRIDLWYEKLSPRLRWFKRSIWMSLKALKAVSGIVLTPSLALAIRKKR